MSVLIALLAIVGLIAVSAVLRGFVLSVLWAWFIETRFGLPPLSVTQAIGTILVASAITHRFVKNNEVEPYEPFADIFISPLAFLAFGWCVKAAL